VDILKASVKCKCSEVLCASRYMQIRQHLGYTFTLHYRETYTVITHKNVCLPFSRLTWAWNSFFSPDTPKSSV